MLGRTASLLMALLLVPAVAYAWTAWPGNDPGWEVNGCPTGGGYSCQADLSKNGYMFHYCQTGVENCGTNPMLPRWDLAMLVAGYNCTDTATGTVYPCVKCDYWYYMDNRCCLLEDAVAPTCPSSFPQPIE